MKQKTQKRNMNRLIRQYRKMLMSDPYFEKRFDIQEVQMAYFDGIVYKRYVFIFKHPNGAVIKKETAWYNVWDIAYKGYTGLFNHYNDFIIQDMKWNGYDKVSSLSEELIKHYQEAYIELSQ